MKHSAEKSKSLNSTTATITTIATTTTTTKIESAIDDDWDKPFMDEELEAIEAAFEAAAADIPPPSSSSSKNPRHAFSGDGDGDDADGRPKSRRRLPGSIVCSNGEVGYNKKSDYFALLPCPSDRAFRPASVKMKYPAMNFGGQVVYGRTIKEVEEATLQIVKFSEAKKQKIGRFVLGLDIEWRPSFVRGVPQGKAAVMQICGDMNHCYVLHIIHSGIPQCLRSLLEDSAFVKVGVGIGNDAVKVFHDHNVSITSVEDLSSLANQKLGRPPKQRSLSSLVETLTCKQLLKPKKIRLGNWETDFLSKAQLQYAATDAFASWYIYEVLKSFPDLSDNNM